MEEGGQVKVQAAGNVFLAAEPGVAQDKGGAAYPWTRKVKAKTVCVALSKEQYDWLKQAIANWRTVKQILRQMQRLSREELFAAIPGPKRRKKLSKKVLGLV